MRRSVLFLLLFPLAQLAFGQYNERIRTARPGQAVGPFTTGKYVFQVQSGVRYTRFNDDPTEVTGDNFQHTTSLRYGLLEKFEIRSAFRERADRVDPFDATTQRFGGFSFWNAGLRYNLVSGESFKPSFGIQTDLRLTWVDKDYRRDHVAPRVMLIHGQKLSDTFTLVSNWSISWTGNGDSPRGDYVLRLGFPVTPKVSGFIENYGGIFEGDFDTRWDTGLGYLINNDLQLDASMGFGRNDEVTDWLIDAGVSWRIKFK